MTEQAAELAGALARCRDEFDLMAVARAMAAMGPRAASAAERLAALMDGPNPSLAAAAAFVIAEIGPPALDAYPVLLDKLTQRLGHPDGEVRHWAAVALGRMGAAAAPAISALLNLLKDTDSGVRVSTMHAIHEIAAFGREAAPSLVPLLDAESLLERQAAVKTLVQADPEAIVSSDLLAETLRNDPSPGSIAAAQAILLMNAPEPLSKRAINALVRALDAPQPHLRRLAAEAAAQLPAIPEPIVNALAQRLSDHDNDVQFETMQALMHADDTAASAFHKILPLLRDHKERARHDALLLLQRISPYLQPLDLPAAIEAVDTAMRDQAPLVRAAAIKTGSALRSAAGLPLDPVLSMIHDDTPSVRIALCEALQAPRALPRVHELLRNTAAADPDYRVRVAAILALSNIQASIEEFLPTLQNALDQPDSQTRIAALHAIGELGRRAAPLEEAVLAISKDPNPFIQELARETRAAIRAIE